MYVDYQSISTYPCGAIILFMKPRREGDRSIMAEVYNYFNSAAELRAINRVRMLHGVINISDITAADGRKLDHVFLVNDAFEGTRNE